MSDDKLDRMEQMMRLLLEEVQGMKSTIKELPTRDELLSVQQTAVTVEDKSESSYVILDSLQKRLNTKLDEIEGVVIEGFTSTGQTLDKIYTLNKSLVTKYNSLDKDVQELKRKLG